MSSRPLAQIKGADEKRWAIKSAANTLKEFFRIKKDKPLLKAARTELKRQLAETKAAIKIT